MPNQQSIMNLIAALKAANNIINDIAVPDSVAWGHFEVASALEAQLCGAIVDARANGEQIRPEEQDAIDEILLDPNDQPIFLDSFKSELFRLRAA
ncbi:hypothetical protein QA649_34415 [Bradyrhizobium sp. CB1717]|uniref:hypothetical protein n=1 Tax=Bradyrhizobium sp. CB1717 TaxID=3039154 RepID=UPI0024B08641|nr:hypothetical protein [Bradyrhizobium sp. CB1717]WFU23137.1 hypothetical protein QA649_34415 [Bradyrhizobium sp. CB1717]